MIDPSLLKSWRIDMSHERPDILIAGSPERSDFRMVIEDCRGELFVVEALSFKLRSRKRRIAEILEQLRLNGLMPVFPYRRDSKGSFLLEHEGYFWQVVPYLPGIQLDRPGYVFDLWRGESAANFLLEMRSAAPVIVEPAFSLPGYIEQLMAAIRRNRQDISPQVDIMYNYVKDHLFPVYDKLPVCFAHGDFHAINIIWKERGIAAVIDWEFCGLKPELYDAANMVSCLGIEDPECLWSGAPVSFLEHLRLSGKYAEISFRHFTDLMIAFRFAWLSEWLRKNDEEMIRMEFDYFDILSSLARAGGQDGSSVQLFK
ncbi:MAG: aminoglycoside phosphotransferase family protein [Candidatus Omnitrophica bacterium]|nr:aminoglycoside phosphotransferase family protein [Candidatus Omnitrophota bacterium]